MHVQDRPGKPYKVATRIFGSHSDTVEQRQINDLRYITPTVISGGEGTPVDEGDMKRLMDTFGEDLPYRREFFGKIQSRRGR
jgi:hypothetical protein